ncbi:MAG: molybdopterin converting factor [Dehalococcoidia bacterium]|nr:molybdopterin converting factor [Dehalococcoidia bacterium]
MKVNLRLFAALHDLVGARQVSLELEDGATIDDLKARLSEVYPALQPMIKTVVCAIGEEYVSPSERVPAGAEVALIPPVSGGSNDLFRVTKEPLAAQALADLVRRDEAGAIALFYGVVRNNSEGRDVERLEYEAYGPMALRKLAEVAEETKRRFPAVSVVGAWHRTGLLEIGETSLLVAVSSPHRLDAFEACHWAVDRIKEVVPVWKKEYWRGGSAWLEGHTVEPPRLADA